MSIYKIYTHIEIVRKLIIATTKNIVHIENYVIENT